MEWVFSRQAVFVLALPMFLMAPTAFGEITSSEVESIKQLYNDSFNRYNNKIRPVLNQSDAVEVKIHCTPVSFLSLDTSEQIFEVIVHFDISWADELLAWDPKMYHNTKRISVSTDDIWHPRMVYFKSSTDNSRIGGDGKNLILVDYKGTVQWHPLQRLSTICDVSVKYYPLDIQTCAIYINDAEMANWKVTYNLTSTFVSQEHPEWEVLSIESESFVHYSADVMKITYKLRRRHSLTMYTLAAPLLIMAVLNVFIFLLPVASGEKSSVAITLFLSYGVLMVVTRDMLPDNSLDISLLVQYVFVLLVFSGFTVAYSIMESFIHAYYCDKQIKLSWLSKAKIGNPEVKKETKDTVKWNEDTEEGIHAHTTPLSIKVDYCMKMFDITMFILVLIGGTVYSFIIFSAISTQDD